MTDIDKTPLTDEEVETAKKFPATKHGLWVSAEFARDLERRLNAARERSSETSAQPLPTAVRLALKGLLNHVEPGWENSKAIVQAWLDAGQQANAANIVQVLPLAPQPETITTSTSAAPGTSNLAWTTTVHPVSNLAGTASNGTDDKSVPPPGWLADLEALEEQATPGPYYVATDDAHDAPAHRDSGLALIDTGRESDWPVLRLGEWPTTKFIAALLNAWPHIKAHPLVEGDLATQRAIGDETDQYRIAAICELDGCKLLHQNPIMAWLHKDHGNAYVITDRVKDLWQQVDPRHVENYIVPLYAAPQPNAAPQACSMQTVVTSDLMQHRTDVQTPDKHALTQAVELDAKHQAEWNAKIYPQDEAATLSASHCDAFRSLAYTLEHKLAEVREERDAAVAEGVRLERRVFGPASAPSSDKTLPTPRCDALHPLDSFDCRAWSTLARQLERELAECRKLLEGEHDAHMECHRELAEAVKVRNEAIVENNAMRDRAEAAEADWQAAGRELAEAKRFIKELRCAKP